MIPDKKYEEMERYVNLEMTDIERNSFEQEVAQSNELAKVVALYKDIPNRLNNIQADLDFNQKLQSARNSYSKAPNRSTSWKWLVIGITLIIVAGLVWKQFISTDSDITQEEEIEQTLPDNVPIASLWNDTDMPPAYITRSGQGVEADIETYQNAHRLYAQKNYTEALTGLEAITASSNVYAEMLLLKGVIQYELNKYEDAIQSYNNYIELDTVPQDMVLWYQALAYIEIEQIDKAKSNLQSIIDNDYNKAEIAKSLLEKL